MLWSGQSWSPTLGSAIRSARWRLFFFWVRPATGKSQIGRSLAQILHGTDTGLVVVNCTEFMNPHDVSKLTGAPPGYIGHDHPPFLTPERLEKKFTIVIFEFLRIRTF